jgi:hypothetical protein
MHTYIHNKEKIFLKMSEIGGEKTYLNVPFQARTKMPKHWIPASATEPILTAKMAV